MDGILVLDIGSSSTRALVFDERANLIPGLLTRRSGQFRVMVDGTSEDDALQVYERVVGCIDEMQQLVTNRGITLRAAGISSYACSLVCLDKRGEPLTPVYTYADTRSASDARILRSVVDELQELQRTGCRIRANYVPPRIEWLHRIRPDLTMRTSQYASLSDYLALRLFGTERGGLSIWSWSGLINRTTHDWDDTWLTRLGITTEQLPALAHPNEWLGTLRPEFERRWPMLKSVPFLPAFGDGAVANIGSGCTDPQSVAVTIGTTAALRVVRSSQQSSLDVAGGEVLPLPQGLWCYQVDHARELIGGATTEGGNVFAWLRQTCKVPEPDELERAMALLPPDAQGIAVLPFFAGERSPGYSEHSRATIHGLTFDATPIVLARACLEAVAYRLGEVYSELKAMAEPGAMLIASGGALLASPTWCQIVADVMDTTLRVCEEPEATARGVALLVLEKIGDISSVADLPARIGVTYQPDPQRHSAYLAAMSRQQHLYAQLMK